jgi:transposase
VFRNRAGTGLKILCYDGQGFWLCTKRLSTGLRRWWPGAERPGAERPAARLSARELQILLWNGLPEQAAMAEDWRRVA